MVWSSGFWPACAWATTKMCWHWANHKLQTTVRCGYKITGNVPGINAHHNAMVFISVVFEPLSHSQLSKRSCLHCWSKNLMISGERVGMAWRVISWGAPTFHNPGTPIFTKRDRPRVWTRPLMVDRLPTTWLLVEVANPQRYRVCRWCLFVCSRLFVHRRFLVLWLRRLGIYIWLIFGYIYFSSGVVDLGGWSNVGVGAPSALRKLPEWRVFNQHLSNNYISTFCRLLTWRNKKHAPQAQE